MNQDEELELLVQFALDQKFISLPSELKEFLKRSQRKYRRILLTDDYNSEQADEKLNSIYAGAASWLARVSSQLELEDLIDADIYDRVSKTRKLAPYHSMHNLPGFKALAPFRFDQFTWVYVNLEHEGPWGLAKPVIRYMPIWAKNATESQQAGILQRLMESEASAARHPLAMYIDRLIERFGIDHKMISKIFDFVYTEDGDYLPMFSSIPIDAIGDRQIRTELQKLKAVDPSPIETDNIFPVKHVNNFAGGCSNLDEGHFFSTVRENTRYGNFGNCTLIYVEGQLIGSIKMTGDNSIIAFRSVKNSDGRLPALAGGAYVTTNEITELAISAYRTQGKFARLDLSTLPLLPIKVAFAGDAVEFAGMFLNAGYELAKAYGR